MMMRCGLKMTDAADHCCDLNIDLNKSKGAVPDAIVLNGAVFRFDTINDAGQPMFTLAQNVYHYDVSDAPPELDVFPAHCG